MLFYSRQPEHGAGSILERHGLDVSAVDFAQIVLEPHFRSPGADVVHARTERTQTCDRTSTSA
jgi:hypothetical protein